jgi:hypothetical protein
MPDSMRSRRLRNRRASVAGLAAAAVAVGVVVGVAQGTGPTAIAVVSGNRTQAIARFALGQWQVVGDAHACDAAGFRFTARQGSLRATAGVALMPVRPVTAAPERAAVDAIITPLFATREREQRVDARDLARAPVSVDVMSAAASPAGVLYYFEASKRLHDAGPPADADADGEVDPRGIVRVTVSGWLRSGARIAPVGTKSELHWDPLDDRGRARPGPDLEPLGIAANGAEPLWVMQRTIGDRVSYLLYAVGESSIRLVLTVPAVSC